MSSIGNEAGNPKADTFQFAGTNVAGPGSSTAAQHEIENALTPINDTAAALHNIGNAITH